MSEALREIERELSDPSRYVRVPARVIFDEHDEEYYEDADGKPCRKGDPGARRKVRRFDRARLEQIAANCNRRDATGSLAPLTFGHTDPAEKDESKQPAPVGYAHGYEVAYSPDLKRHVLRADFYLKKDRYEQAKTFPRVSIELWEKHGVIDPVSLLRRTPARDLGQWTYGRAGAVLRYSMEFAMDPLEDDLDEGPAEGGEPEGGMKDEDVEQYRRHCYGHPLAGKYHSEMAKRYAMPAGDGAAEPPPVEPPDADAGPEEPLMNGMAAASASNGAAPGKGKGKGAEKPTAFARDMDRVAYSRIERELQQTREQVGKLLEERNLEIGRRLVATLVAEGFELDADKEARRFSKLDQAGRDERVAEIRGNYRQAPVGYDRRVEAERPAAGDEQLGEAELQRALRYAREKGCSFDEAHRAVRQSGAN